jgi:hypothetical protein
VFRVSKQRRERYMRTAHYFILFYYYFRLPRLQRYMQ